MLRKPRRAALVAVFVALALPAAAAQADGPRTPITVAHGHSLYGAPWSIRCGEEPKPGPKPDYLTCHFSVGTKAEHEEIEGGGYFSSTPLPLPRSFPFDGTFGGDFDNYEESDFSGITGPLVTRLALKMKDGSVVEADLLRAPKRVVARHPRIGRFRFFDVFFPNTAEPTSIAVYGRSGDLIEKRSLK
jgi:hypothetical protein